MTITSSMTFASLGTAHYLCFGLGPKRNSLGKRFFRQPLTWVNNFARLSRVRQHILVALHWLGKYYFCSPQGWVT